MTTLEEKIYTDAKNSMYSGDAILKDTLKSIKASLVTATKEKNAEKELSEMKILEILRSMIKQRKESASIFKKNKREDLAIIEEKQVEIINKYIPTELTDKELRKAIIPFIGLTNSYTTNDIGKLLKAIMPELGQKAERGRIATMARELLQIYEKQNQ